LRENKHILDADKVQIIAEKQQKTSQCMDEVKNELELVAFHIIKHPTKDEYCLTLEGYGKCTKIKSLKFTIFA
jgi:hypothetical protein